MGSGRVPSRGRAFGQGWNIADNDPIPSADAKRSAVMSIITNIDIVTVQPIVALTFGILILLVPRLLNYLIAAYLIFIGLIGLWPHFFAALT
jgi:hypothetical protein